jgi:hypothetical protein
MSVVSKAVKLITDRRYLMINLMNAGFYDRLPDEAFIRKQFRIRLGREPDLEDPKTFNEKLQWLKLHDRRPEYTALVDKYAVKSIVAERIGEEHIVPTIGCYSDPEEIPFDSLPEKYVLKCTHNSGTGTILCRDNKKLDRRATVRELKRGLAEDYYLKVREWPYKGVPHRIVCERFLENDGSSDMPDYKLHCFYGEPKFILVCRDRFSKTGMTEDFFTPDWEHIPVSRPAHPNASVQIERPPMLDEMMSIARELSRDIPFVRVDLYVAGGRIYFGEMTFFPSSGAAPFVPEEYDRVFGDMLDLSPLR